MILYFNFVIAESWRTASLRIRAKIDRIRIRLSISAGFGHLKIWILVFRPNPYPNLPKSGSGSKILKKWNRIRNQGLGNLRPCISDCNQSQIILIRKPVLPIRIHSKQNPDPGIVRGSEYFFFFLLSLGSDPFYFECLIRNCIYIKSLLAGRIRIRAKQRVKNPHF